MLAVLLAVVPVVRVMRAGDLRRGLNMLIRVMRAHAARLVTSWTRVPTDGAFLGL
jgi:hypothetical protein